ncbi:MAG: hypothetical protein ACQEWL_14635 [Pseudomonadota bacterium]
MPVNLKQLYSVHVENLRELKLAITHVDKLAKTQVASKDPQKSLNSLLRLYSFLIGAWAETRLCKLLYEVNAFTIPERDLILEKRSQLGRWKETIDTAFCKHYGIQKSDLNKTVMGEEDYNRWLSLHDILKNELKNIIEIRNKLAHGQWIYPLNNKGTGISQDKFNLIKDENLLTLKFKFNLITLLANTVNDLVVSHPTFHRDFTKYFHKLVQVRHNLRQRSYSKFERTLIEAHDKSRLIKRNIR